MSKTVEPDLYTASLDNDPDVPMPTLLPLMFRVF
jgi:hypothetical protein